MTYNLEYISNEFKEKLSSALLTPRKVDKVLSYKILQEAIALPFVDWEHYGKIVEKDNVDALRQYKQEEITSEHKNIVYLGCLNTCFGHWFTDNLSETWFLFDKQFKEVYASNEYELAYTLSRKSPLTDEEMSFFDLLGVNLRNAILINSPMQFDSILIPDHAFLGSSIGHQYTAEMEAVWKRVSEKVKSMPPAMPEYPSKIYFSRMRLCPSKDYGEKAIERVFKKRGYAIVYPETLPVVHKIQLMQNCKYFASTEGSTSHLTLFCTPGTNVTLVPRARWVNSHQLCCNEYAELNVTYLEADRSNMVESSHPWRGPFYFCITSFVEKFAGHKILHLPDEINPEYWKYTRNIMGRILGWLSRRINNFA